MLTEEQILENKNRFINLLQTIKREGADIDGLIKKLETSDFFTAPASTMYHSAYKGGLCQHSLNVYDNLCKLIAIKYPEDCNYNSDNIIITALLHDISKMNFYEVSERNVKDDNGNWTKVPFLKVRDGNSRFLYSTHGVNSEYMVGSFIPLMFEESVAIINHMGNSDETPDQSFIYNKYPLAVLLHSADMIATFFDENI